MIILHAVSESIEAGLLFNKMRELQEKLDLDLDGDGDSLVSLELSNQILSSDLIGAHSYVIYSYNKPPKT